MHEADFLFTYFWHHPLIQSGHNVRNQTLSVLQIVQDD